MILFHALDNINPIFIGSYYGHVGLVYVDPDDPDEVPYLFEAAATKNMNLRDNKKIKGIFLENLYDRCSRYKGYVFYKELQHKIETPVIHRFKNLVEYCMDKMYYEYNIITNVINHSIGGEALGNNTNCSELCFLSLLKLELLPMEYFKHNIINYMRWTANITNLKGNKYLTPVYIKIDPFGN
jgi:hypothetical protein